MKIGAPGAMALRAAAVAVRNRKPVRFFWYEIYPGMLRLAYQIGPAIPVTVLTITAGIHHKALASVEVFWESLGAGVALTDLFGPKGGDPPKAA